MIRWQRLRLAPGGSVTIAVQDWQSLSTTAAWTAGVAPVSYFKDPFGVVHLRGSGTASGSGTLFTLPVGCRPEYVELFGNVQVSPSGSVSAVTGAVSLSGISFRPA